MSNKHRTTLVGIKYMLDWTNIIQAILKHHVQHCLMPFGACSARFDTWIDILVNHCPRQTAPNIELCQMTLNNVRHLFNIHLV